ncbi:Nramp family divalent metal transporter [Subtercola endophyticus]|uniref:Nramp family divalent metal transporter n=1 Tax=Subtercola endophyticus TaxID=2895559 RepID=UPI001E3CDC30|nr:Nramp family divalent metal transporter [Subtercola endophyticus]UFS58876.1 Nramp family divalent metal transporter [Subtercola endophyticus]
MALEQRTETAGPTGPSPAATSATGATSASSPAAPPSKPRSRAGTTPRLLFLLGPAFVAAIAYVDPGNVAANLTAGARYGYLLVWVLVAANGMAMIIQYQSAKLGIVTGHSLPELLGGRMRKWSRRSFWVQAELVAAATDLAEVIGGAIALQLLFGLPLLLGGLIVGVISMAILAVQSRRGQRPFETVIMTLLAVIAVGFLAGLFVSPVDWGEAAGGLVPRFAGTDTVLLAAGMLGATVMPHAIYLHSSLARDRHVAPSTPTTPIELRVSAGASPEHPHKLAARRAASADTAGNATELHGGRAPAGIRRLLHATKWDVLAALILAGAVNIAMLLTAAANLGGVTGTDTIAGAHAAITAALGPTIGVIFAVGLLASGLASTSVGSYAGATIMAGLLRVRIPLLLRRVITLIPALIILGAGVNPTWALVLSQVFLSLGIPFALIPLIRLTSDRMLMGTFANRLPVRVLCWGVAVLIVALNLALIGLTISGGLGG